MKKRFGSQTTTNILLLVIAALLGIHLAVKMPILTTAQAQTIPTTTEDYLKSMDKNILDIKGYINSIRTDVRLLQSCVVNTPVGGKAVQTKPSN